MKFDIALTFIAAAYAMELRTTFPETIEERKLLHLVHLPIFVTRDCFNFEFDEIARHTPSVTAEEVELAKHRSWMA